MENKIKVAFDLSKISFTNNDCLVTLTDFISKFIYDSNDMADFYFLLELDESKSNQDFDFFFKDFKEKILAILKEKKILDTNYSINFGYYKNPELLDDSKLVSYEYGSNLEIDLFNNETIFFFCLNELGDFLNANNYFYYYLNFSCNDNDEKRIKKNLKISDNVVNDENYIDITFSKINYEFLTFLEQFEN